MAKVFLDANALIDLILARNKTESELFNRHLVIASPLSAHICSYIDKRKTPDEEMLKISDQILWHSFDGEILKGALQGPTSDLEDNIQLHSAASADCELFLTSDQKLLKLKFFGAMKIVDTIESK